MMWLVLAHSGDAVAHWAALGLRDAGLAPLELVTAEELCIGASWEHRVSSERASVGIELADGRVIAGDRLGGVLNRLTHVPAAYLSRVAASDRRYVTAEVAALLLSALEALPCRVVNRPHPLGLSGHWRWPAEWHNLATEAGLPVTPYALDSDRGVAPQAWSNESPPETITLLVVGDAVIGHPVEADLRAGCRRLARLAGTDLLGVELARTGACGVPRFLGATPMPDLRGGGSTALAALVTLLRRPDAEAMS
jgi:hypothetical protein